MIKDILKAVAKRTSAKLYGFRLERAVEVRVHLVKPSEIRFRAKKLPGLRLDREHIVGGDWDALDQPFHEYDMVQAFRSVVERRESWRDQPFFRRISQRIDAGENMWGCRTIGAFLERLSQLEILYGEMKRLGYLANNNFDEVTLGVGRDGDLLLLDGAHRLAVAQMLNLPAIPVRVSVRHAEWAKFRNYLMEYAYSHKKGAYAPVLHPDLEWISSFYGHKRFELIRRAMDVKQGTLLDIGCNWGYFCDRFEDLGFQCIGVEQDPGNHFVMEKLKRARRKTFETYQGSIFDFAEKGPKEYDVVLALGIFHHFVKEKETCERLAWLLERTRTREMYFMPHKSSESQMLGVYWNPTEEQFIAFILEKAKLSNCKLIGYAEDGRKLFKFH